MANNNGPDEPHLAREDLSEHLGALRAQYERKHPHPAVVLPTSDPVSAPSVLFGGRLAEEEPTPFLLPNLRLKAVTRRDFFAYGAGAALAAAGFWWLLPEGTQQRPLSTSYRAHLDSLEARLGLSPGHSAARKERLLTRTLSFDDDVAEALYSPGRLVPTYDISHAARTLRNNYDGQTPDPADYLADWTLILKGLASGRTEHLTLTAIQRLVGRFGRQNQATRLCCVEGWSMIAAWGGLRFADFLNAYPPVPGAKWASLTSSVNLDGDGNSDPYYVSIDLGTARHPQTLLATHQNDPQRRLVPLTAEHGAPLRLLAPMKLGLKNIKAITGITYMASEPPDYWNERGYSKYDAL